MNKKIKENLLDEIRKLEMDNLKLKQENQSLTVQLNELNENTIVQSMNDMKTRYEQLERTSIPIRDYQYLKMEMKDYKRQTIAINKINDKKSNGIRII